jgi:hypothetical protein
MKAKIKGAKTAKKMNNTIPARANQCACGCKNPKTHARTTRISVGRKKYPNHPGDDENRNRGIQWQMH